MKEKNMKKQYIRPKAFFELMENDCLLVPFTKVQIEEANNNGSSDKNNVPGFGLGGDNQTLGAKQSNLFYDDSEWDSEWD